MALMSGNWTWFEGNHGHKASNAFKSRIENLLRNTDVLRKTVVLPVGKHQRRYQVAFFGGSFDGANFLDKLVLNSVDPDFPDLVVVRAKANSSGCHPFVKKKPAAAPTRVVTKKPAAAPASIVTRKPAADPASVVTRKPADVVTRKPAAASTSSTSVQ